MYAFFQTFLLVVYVYSSVSKAAEWAVFRETIFQLKFSKRAAAAGAVLIPLAEFATAGLLLFNETIRHGAVCSLVLLAIFLWAGIRARGRLVDCRCFGGLIDDRFGRNTNIRIGVLSVVSLVLLFAPMSSTPIYQARETFVTHLLIAWSLLVLYGLLAAVRRYKKTFA
ncbi:MauE/DoxX family redox-associated membrane protein [Cohnella algarum]|uniref:MauE/DoxX family redox-associated membrane protein n=1 Tax=Cohnella algarum TaxID=2044859 RepID=UPI0019681103|nr:MauE/DoxX family redox-associated membrane protein [Cohnella algarum]MBN2984167.1 hypothetical protein [Cohnella algarum]